MTVLRSGVTVPTRAPLKTLEKGVIEPTTPAKTKEPSNHSSSPALTSTPPLGLVSDSVSVSGAIRRRSLRLASKSNSNGVTTKTWISGGRRKRKRDVAGENGVYSNEEKCNNNESDYENVERAEELGDRVSASEAKKVGVLEGMDESKMSLDGMVSVVDQVTELGLGEEGKEELKEKRVGKLGLSSDLGTFRQMIVGKAKGKRKLKIDINLVELELGGEDEGDQRFLNLRSGAKIAKRRMDGISIGFEKSVLGRERGKSDKEDRRVLSDGGRVGVGIEKLEKNPSAYENGTVRFDKDKEDKGKGKLVEDDLSSEVTDIVKLDENVKRGMVRINVGFIGVENDGNKAVHEREGEGTYQEGNRRLSHGSGEGVAMKELEKDPSADENGPVKGRRRFRWEEKGKRKLAKDVLLSNGIDQVELDLEPGAGTSINDTVSDAIHQQDNVALQDERQIAKMNTRLNASRRREYKKRFRDIARQNASRFAHFPPQEEEEEENHSSFEAEREVPTRVADRESEDWPGPFSTAMKIIKERATNLNVQQQSPSFDKRKPAPVVWIPRKDQDCDRSKQLVPSLQELCMTILAKNVDAIASLEHVPDVLSHKLSQLLCDSRRMNSHFLDLLVHGSPAEIRVRDCSWLTEEQFTRTFEGCDTKILVVLQLDQCGPCMPDYILLATLAWSSNSLPALSTISLRGAYRLSDVGLSALVSSAPALRSINLSQCSLLTSTGIDALAETLGSVLRELYIDDCQNIDAMLILPALKKLEHLEVLSLAGIQTVCDGFISEFITVRGHNMKELVLTDCVKLTDSSLKVIAETCSGLCAIELVNLCKLTDSAMGYLANGCRVIQTLKLCRNAFSDEAIAAFLENSGESLKELSLNNVKKVGNNTAISLARRSRKLLSLDLSWCRNLADEALGLIVDSCLSLRVLKLFGCSQITNVFLDGHSNPQVQIIGLKMTPILEYLNVPDPQEDDNQLQ